MHYKNGRPAKNGDRVVDTRNGIVGILHSTNANATSCNGRVATQNPNDAYVTLGDCLHVDDIAGAAATIPDTSKPAEASAS